MDSNVEHARGPGHLLPLARSGDHSLMWHGPLFVSRRRDLLVAVLKEDVEFVPNYVFDERQILIEAIETWLTAPPEGWACYGDHNTEFAWTGKRTLS